MSSTGTDLVSAGVNAPVDAAGSEAALETAFGTTEAAAEPVLLDLDAGGEAATETVTEKQAEGGEAAAGGEAEQVATGPIPPDVLSVFNNPAKATPEALAKAKAWAQSANDQLTHYRGLGTVRDARTFAENFPGGVKEALEFREKALVLDDADNRFESGDPAQHKSMASEWYEMSPDNFVPLVSQAVAVLRERNPEGFAQFSGQILRDAFTQNKWDVQVEAIAEQLGMLSEEAMKDPQTARLVRLSAWLVQQADKAGIAQNGRGRTRPEDDALAKRTETLSQREQQLHVERVNYYSSNVANEAQAQVGRALDQSLTTLLEKSAFSDKGRAAIRSEIISGVSQRLVADKAFQNNLARAAREAGFDVTKRTQSVAMLVGRAKALLAGVTKQVIAEHTERLVTANKATNAKKEGTTGKAEITGGQAPTVRPRKFTQTELQRMSPEDRDAIVNQSMGI